MTQGKISQVVDGTIGLGAVSLPLWLQGVETWLTFGVLVGGAILLIMRLLLTYREIKNKPEKEKGLE